jgi:CheY-like chemotaxis protein
MAQMESFTGPLIPRGRRGTIHFSDFAWFIREKAMKQEQIERSLNPSNTLTHREWLGSSRGTHLSPEQVNKHRILCVDDEIIGLEIRGQILREQGYSAVLYHSPLEVLHCDLSMFDLAILDFEMPELNGPELLLRMRSLGARFPVVLLTGCLATLSRKNLVLFARHIDKGMPVNYLLDTIASLLDPNQVPDYGA